MKQNVEMWSVHKAYTSEEWYHSNLTATGSCQSQPLFENSHWLSKTDST